MTPESPDGPGGLIAIGECMAELSAAVPASAAFEGGAEARTFRLGFAGDTFNTAWYARGLLGSERSVRYVTAVGRDGLSDDMLRFMDRSGIGTGLVGRVPDRTVGLYMIELSRGERSFVYWRAQSAARLLARHLPRVADAVGKGDVIHVSGITFAILEPDDRATLLDWIGGARSEGATVSFDPNIRPALWESEGATSEWTARVAALADIALPSLDEEQRSFGAGDAATVAARYREWGAGTVVVKNGDAPGLVATPDRAPRTFEPVHAPRVVDTTAAGDSFNAAFLAAMMKGREPLACAAAGAALAARVVGGHGALVRAALDAETNAP